MYRWVSGKCFIDEKAGTREEIVCLLIGHYKGKRTML